MPNSAHSNSDNETIQVLSNYYIFTIFYYIFIIHYSYTIHTLFIQFSYTLQYLQLSISAFDHTYVLIGGLQSFLTIDSSIIYILLRSHYKLIQFSLNTQLKSAQSELSVLYSQTYSHSKLGNCMRVNVLSSLMWLQSILCICYARIFWLGGANCTFSMRICLKCDWLLHP